MTVKVIYRRNTPCQKCISKTQLINEITEGGYRGWFNVKCAHCRLAWIEPAKQVLPYVVTRTKFYDMGDSVAQMVSPD